MQSIKEIPVKLTQLFDTVHHMKKIEKGTFLFQEGSTANELYKSARLSQMGAN
jgi:CRP/FNR family transcriptional regulator